MLALMRKLIREPLLHFLLAGADAVVRRRIAQKVEFILDSAIPATPTETEPARLPVARPAWTPYLVPYAIGSIAMFWVVERVGAFF